MKNVARNVTMSPAAARALAQQAYIYAYAPIWSYNTWYKQAVDKNAHEYNGGFNTFRHYAEAFTPENRDIVTPNNDTPYSWATLDLRAEPIVLSVPAVPRRYYVMQLIDLFTFNFAYVGSRTTGNKAGNYLIAGPAWKGKTPRRIRKVFRSETDIVEILGRTQLDGTDDIPAVKGIQAGYRLQPLSAFLKKPARRAAPALTFPVPDLAREQTRDLIGYLNFLLQFAQPPHKSEAALMKRFAKLGIGPGLPWNAAKVDSKLLAAIDAGITDAKAAFKAQSDKTLSSNGLFGSRAFMKNDYMMRAIGAEKGLYGNSLEEAWYGGYIGDGTQLCTIHFSKAELPPAKFFWSLTLYTLPDRLLYANDLQRYSIGDRTRGLVYGKDGSLTLYVGRDAPGKDKESNWLPAPTARYSLVGRVYGPSKAAMTGKWKLPGLQPITATTRAIAKVAYIYGVPIVSMYMTMYVFSIDKSNPEYKGPFNTVLNFARVFTPDDTAFVTPNSDTPYTFLGLDLRAEPMVISIPAMEKSRYFVFQLMDLYTFNFAYLGSRTSGNGGGNYLIAGPNWKGRKPKGISQVIRAETELVNIVGRTQMFNPADLDNVKKVQTGYKAQSLSAFLGTEAPPAAAAVDWVKPVLPADQRTSLEFFNVLAFALQFAPNHPSEIALRRAFESIGIIPGKRIDFANLPAATKSAFSDGMTDGQNEIDARRATLKGSSADLFGTRAFLKNDYVRRALGTQVGIGANSKEEALYPIYEKDSAGQALDGSKGRYTLRFRKGKFPPVNAFWSVTMYALPSQLLVKNPINRYLINSPMLPGLKRNPDGGVTIYIQSESPGADCQANWLPAPSGPFMMAVRYYWPKAELLKGQWKSPPVERTK